MGAPDGIDAKDFRRALGRFTTGVTVISVRTAGGRDQAMTASAFSSLSLDPPLIMVAVKKLGQMHGLLAAASGFAVNVLSEHQRELSNRFAGGIVDADGAWRAWPVDRDRFADLDVTHAAVSGAALIGGALAHLDCRLHAAPDGGDHSIFIGEVASLVLAERPVLRPLLHFAGSYRALAADAHEEMAEGLRVPDWFG